MEETEVGFRWPERCRSISRHRPTNDLALPQALDLNMSGEPGYIEFICCQHLIYSRTERGVKRCRN